MLEPGVYPAAVTPMTAQGEVDEPSVARLLAYFEAAGCKGVVLAGTNGEGPSLSAYEKRDLLRLANTCKGRLELVLGIATPSLDEARWSCEQAAKNGAVAVLVMPPSYFRTATEDGIADWFTTLAADSPTQVLAYNFPKMTGFTMSPAFIAKLAAHPNIIGFKDSSGEPANLATYHAATLPGPSPGSTNRPSPHDSVPGEVRRGQPLSRAGEGAAPSAPSSGPSPDSANLLASPVSKSREDRRGLTQSHDEAGPERLFVGDETLPSGAPVWPLEQSNAPKGAEGAADRERKLFVGDETLLLDALSNGWTGTISGAANCIPQWLSKIVADRDETKFAIALPVIKAIRAQPQPATNKAVLHALGVISTPHPRLPLKAADPSPVLEAMAHHLGISPANLAL